MTFVSQQICGIRSDSLGDLVRDDCFDLSGCPGSCVLANNHRNTLITVYYAHTTPIDRASLRLSHVSHEHDARNRTGRASRPSRVTHSHRIIRRAAPQARHSRRGHFYEDSEYRDTSCRDASRSEKATQGVRRPVGTPEDHAHLHTTHAPRALRVLRPPLTPATPDEQCDALCANQD